MGATEEPTNGLWPQCLSLKAGPVQLTVALRFQAYCQLMVPIRQGSLASSLSLEESLMRFEVSFKFSFQNPFFPHKDESQEFPDKLSWSAFNFSEV